MSAVIEMHGVSKSFGAARALDSVSLTIRENEFYALLGPSGCGKTTLLRVLAGFETPDEGDIALDGKDLIAIRPNRRPVNMMFQTPMPLPASQRPSKQRRLRPAHGPRSRRPRSRQRTRDALLPLVQLDGLGEPAPKSAISGGQRQRGARARGPW